jgi:hypothetical protein
VTLKFEQKKRKYYQSQREIFESILKLVPQKIDHALHSNSPDSPTSEHIQ